MEERRSYSNLIGSTALHGALLALLLLGFASAPRFADTPEDAFAILKESLTLNHLGGKKPETGRLDELLDEESEMSLRPEIRKTRP